VVGAHPCKGFSFDPSDPWYERPRPVGAATAALLAVRRDDFALVGGFDEDLATCYQDVDLALKFAAKGKTNWVLPDVVAIHHETSTRRPVHHWSEVALMSQRWGKTLEQNPFYSDELSRWSEQPALTLGEGHYPWRYLAKES
jgi:GT2 family glycosyltransferase